MGFGHRVYKNYDPRARIIKKIAEEVFSILGREPLIEVAVELEKIALSDPYFVERKLYPNVDFYSGLIYKAMGFPTDYFPVLFTIPRTVGWLAHWYVWKQDMRCCHTSLLQSELINVFCFAGLRCWTTPRTASFVLVKSTSAPVHGVVELRLCFGSYHLTSSCIVFALKQRFAITSPSRTVFLMRARTS